LLIRVAEVVNLLIQTMQFDVVDFPLGLNVTDFGTSMGENAGEMVVAGQRGDYVGQGMAGVDLAGQMAAVVPVLRATSIARANVARAGIEGTKPLTVFERSDGGGSGLTSSELDQRLDLLAENDLGAFDSPEQHMKYDRRRSRCRPERS